MMVVNIDFLLSITLSSITGISCLMYWLGHQMSMLLVKFTLKANFFYFNLGFRIECYFRCSVDFRITLLKKLFYTDEG